MRQLNEVDYGDGMDTGIPWEEHDIFIIQHETMFFLA